VTDETMTFTDGCSCGNCQCLFLHFCEISFHTKPRPCSSYNQNSLQSTITL